MQPPQLPHYPIVNLFVRHGGLLSALAGLLPLGLAIWAIALGAGLEWLIAGALGGAALWLFVRSYVEVLHILADALMPR